ncbi:MAG: hypothetical protein JSV03_12845 [Planctomycetota bacterium]|nr:MAG: hypothetical protein JSV03_12845 [Planctomycetota bacterium]
MMNLFSLQVMLDELAARELILGLFLMGAGLVFIIMGFRVFKVIIPLSFGVIGFVIGACMPLSFVMQMVCACVFAIGLAVVSIMTIKISVAVLAGAWSGLAVILFVSLFTNEEYALYLTGGFAFVAVVSLSFISYREIIAFVTSLEGTLLALAGMVIFVAQFVVLWHHLRDLLLHTPIFAPFLVITGTVTGYYLQVTELRQKKTGISG